MCACVCCQCLGIPHDLEKQPPKRGRSEGLHAADLKLRTLFRDKGGNASLEESAYVDDGSV